MHRYSNVVNEDTFCTLNRVKQNNLRNGPSIQPPEVATIDIVSDSFSWRMLRRIHGAQVCGLPNYSNVPTGPRVYSLNCVLLF